MPIRSTIYLFSWHMLSGHIQRKLSAPTAALLFYAHHNYLWKEIIWAPRPNTTAVCCKNVLLAFWNTSNYVTKCFTFQIGLTAYNILYIMCVATSRYLTKPLTLNFGTVIFIDIKIFILCISDFTFYIVQVYGTRQSGNLQFLSAFHV
jgi:hypothetical protein